MKKLTLALAALALPMSGAAVAQSTMDHDNMTSAKAMASIGVVPGAKIKSFAQFDRDGSMTLSPMEFSQALLFLSAPVGASGGPELPAADMYMHKGTVDRLRPSAAIELLNTTSYAMSVVDLNNDWRISQAELVAAALM